MKNLLTDEFIAEYEKLDLEFKKLESKRKQMRVVISAHMEEKMINYLKTPNGRFTFQERKTYEFPKYIQKLENELDFEKDHYKNSGTAKYISQNILYYHNE